MSELKVIHIKDVKGERREPPRTSWILVSEKTVGAKNLAMGVNETYPGGMVPEHKHDHEEEVMFFLSGRGTFVTPDREIPPRLAFQLCETDSECETAAVRLGMDDRVIDYHIFNESYDDWE